VSLVAGPLTGGGQLHGGDPPIEQAIGFELPQQAIPKIAIGASYEKSIAANEADAKIRLPLPPGVSVSTTPAF
jgi:hypothetical protein